MSTANLYTPAQPTDSTAQHAKAEAITTTAGGQKTTTTNTKQSPALVLMSWAEWAATPKDYRLSKGTQRWVMRAHPAGGVGLFPVHITG